jgi:hypothetical protein
MQDDLKDQLPDVPSPKSPEELLAHFKRAHPYFRAKVMNALPDREITLDDLPALDEVCEAARLHNSWQGRLLDAFESNIGNGAGLTCTMEDVERIQDEIIRIMKFEGTQVRAITERVIQTRKKEQSAQSVLRRLRTEKAARPKDALPQPPLNAQFFLYLFLEKEGREEAVGDALENYSKCLKRFGKLRANIDFYVEVWRNAWPCTKRVVTGIGLLTPIIALLQKLISWWFNK